MVSRSFLRRTQRWLAATAVLPLVLLCSAAGWANPVVVLVSGQSAAYSEMLDSLNGELRRAPAVRSATGVWGTSGWDGVLATVSPASTQIVVAVGASATRAALDAVDPRIPILAVLLPRSTYETVNQSIRPAGSRRLSALYLDQPLARQFNLVVQALPQAARVGVVLGPESGREAERLESLAEGRNLAIAVERIARDSALYPALQKALGTSDVFLALPDPYVVNAETAQNLLLTSFRQRVPVIGFSAAYVRAGALAAVYSTPAQVGTEAGEMVRQFQRTQALPPPRYPRLFSVMVNRQVASSLSIAVPDEAVLLERLQRAERE